jgi:drug/metabolite transporter (DMT)-like permease
MFIEDTLSSNVPATSAHGVSALVSQKLDQAHDVLQNFIQTNFSNYVRQTSIVGLLAHHSAPKVGLWIVTKIIQILSVMYLYSIIVATPNISTPTDSTETSSTPESIEQIPGLTLSVVAFYVLLGASLGWYAINQFAKPYLGGVQNRKDQEQSSTQAVPGTLLSRIGLHSVWAAVGFYLWLSALQLLAPTRVVVIEYVEYVVVIILGGLLKWRNPKNLHVRSSFISSNFLV